MRKIVLLAFVFMLALPAHAQVIVSGTVQLTVSDSSCTTTTPCTLQSYRTVATAADITAFNALSLTTKVSTGSCVPFWSTGVANIQWSTTVLAVTGSYSYDVRVRLIKLG